jgi:hypothetical protein
LNAAPLKSVSQWIGGYRAFWEASFENLDAYVRELHTKGRQLGTKEKGRYGKDTAPRVRRRRRH